MAQKKKLERENTLGQPVDRFQSAADERLEAFGKKFEGKGKTLIYGLLALVAVAILGAIIYNYSRRADAAGQTALGKAIDIQTAQVSASPVPNNPELTYATEKERAEKANAAFEEVAAKYGSPYREKAQYFIAVNNLKLDRAKGLESLQTLAKSGNNEVAVLSKFALAEANFADGKYNEAAALYNELKAAKTDLVPGETLDYALAQTLEKQGKKDEAGEIYFNIVKKAREAKNADGEPLDQTQTAREASTKLQKLDPARYGQLPPEPTSSKVYNF